MEDLRRRLPPGLLDQALDGLAAIGADNLADNVDSLLVNLAAMARRAGATHPDDVAAEVAGHLADSVVAGAAADAFRAPAAERPARHREVFATAKQLYRLADRLRHHGAPAAAARTRARPRTPKASRRIRAAGGGEARDSPGEPGNADPPLTPAHGARGRP